MKKGSEEVNMVYKIILILVAITAALLIVSLIKGKGESLIGDLKNIFSGGLK